MKSLFLLLFLPFAHSLVPRHCPQGCDCLPDSVVPSQFSLSCRWESLVPSTSFASFPPNLIRSLSVICSSSPSSQPVDVSSQLLKDFESLHSLTLQKCALRGLPDAFFRDTRNLRWLSLNSASSSSPFILSAELLAPLTSLERLTIADSRLAQLPAQLFCLLPHLQAYTICPAICASLMNLCWWGEGGPWTVGCTRLCLKLALPHLEDSVTGNEIIGYLCNLWQLPLVLNVSGNELSSLTTATKCRSAVMIVDASRNELKTLDADNLHSFPALRQLSLAHNAISHVETNTFKETPLVQQLDFSYNHLHDLPLLPETVVHVNAASNRFRAVPTSLSALSELVSLSLRRNQITEIETTLATQKLEVLDVSWNSLSSLPSSLLSSPSVLLHLSVEGNSLDTLPSQSLSNFSSLHTLDVGSNKLKSLAGDVFAGLNSLSSLNIANNSLHSLEEGVFNEVPLTQLDLSSNALTELPPAIGRLFKLVSVNLSHNAIERSHAFVFSKLPHLRSVDMSWNRLEAVEDHVLTDCGRLSSVDLSHNTISLLESRAFAKCPQLQRLDLSFNRISAYNGSFTEASALKKLRLDENRVEILQWEELPPQLDVLHASYNRISVLGAALHSRVRRADLRGNRLERIASGQLPLSLEALDLSDNRLSTLDKDVFASKAQLQSLDLRGNSLRELKEEWVRVRDAVHPLSLLLSRNPLHCSCDMNWLTTVDEKSKLIIADRENLTCSHPIDGSRISVEKSESRDFLCEYEQMCEPQCICCAYDKCDCKSRCPSGCHCYRDAQGSVNIVRCMNLTDEQKKVFSPRSVPMYATDVHLSGVSLPVLKTNDFFGRPKLVRLHLNRTGIREIQPKAFNSLPQLQLLDLSNNELTSLGGEELHKVERVSHLFLDGNRLTTFSSLLTRKLPSLKLVTLHSNLLSDLCDGFDASSIQSLSLGGNPFRCDCSFTRFRMPSWLDDNEARVADAGRVQCWENVTKAFLENDTTVLSAFPPNVDADVFAMSMLDFLQEANRTICTPPPSGIFGTEPRSSLLLLLLVLSALLLLAAVVLAAVSAVRKTHSAMQQRRYKASSSLNGSSTTPGSSPLPVPLLTYHAFVSYAKKDEKYVVENLCRKLEEEDFQLCLLHRDGPSYSPSLHVISDELNQQIEASQCLLLVLTRNFLENEWRTVQVRSSHQLFSKNRSKRVIALLGEGVDANRLDHELGQILRKNTVIPIQQPLFWTMLRAAMPAIHSPAPSDSSQIYSDCYGIVPSAVV